MTFLDLDAQDLARAPWEYPGFAASSSGLLLGGRFVAMSPAPGDEVFAQLDAALLDARVAPVGERVLVVAVGSNASPVVLHRKLTAYLASTTVPMVQVEVGGIAVGFSAHVSARGYIPNAPYAAADTSKVLVASLLDAEQLACLDATEPHYRRVRIEAPDAAAVVDGPRLAGFDLYESRWGLLGYGVPLQAPRTQDDLWEELRAAVPGVAALVARLPGARDVMRACATDEALRAKLRSVFEREAWRQAARLA